MARAKIVLMGDPVITEELAATEAITPGHLVMLASATTVSKNTANAADVARNLALDRPELGDEITDAYASGDRVKIGAFAPGQRAYVFIPSGQNISAGNYLEADNAGRFVIYSAGARLAMALEAVNATADTRIRVQIV